MIPDAKDRIEDIKKLGRHFRGRRELIAHYEGKPLTRKQAMEAWCYDCSGYYSDGVSDCETVSCPLYLFMPYRKDKQPKKARSEKQQQASVLLGQRTREEKATNKLKHVSRDENGRDYSC